VVRAIEESDEALPKVVRAFTPLEGAVKIDTPNVQSALEALQGKSKVWRAAHGEYALEEQGLVDLMRGRGLLA
jgi:hypothetical protein